jgi:long-chain acyl-CoA synthetase
LRRIFLFDQFTLELHGRREFFVFGAQLGVQQPEFLDLLDTQLSAEDEELTPTMKLKRKLVEKKYSEQIDAMYRD